jgi:TonB-dependent receptor
LPPGLTNISINGEQVPSPEGEFRYVALDVIPIDQLASIEITKTVTPDMDGDGIGGSVNLITKEAKDDKARVSGAVAGGYNNLMDDYSNYQVQGSYDQRFKKLGVSLNGSIYRNDRGSDNNEFIYQKEDFGNGDEYVLSELQLRDYQVERRRIGLSNTMDYKFSETSEVYVKSLYNYYTDQEFRRRYRFRPGRGTYISPTEVQNIRLVNDLKDREQTQEIWSVNVGGKHGLSKFTFDYEFAYAEASEDELDRIDVGFEHSQRPDVTIDRSDPDFPKFTITDGVDRFDYNAYEFDEIELTDNTRKDRNVTGKVNIKIPLKIGSHDGFIKTGVKYRDKQKNRINVVKVFGNDFVNAADEFTLGDVLGDFSDDNFLDNQYVNGLFADPGKIRSFRDRVRAGNMLEEEVLGSLEESAAPFYEAEEKVLATYLVSRVQFNKLMALAGVRFEKTDVDYRANELIFDQDINGDDIITVNPVSGTNDYTFFLPNLQFKYEMDKNTNMRAAFTWSYARPNFDAIVPSRSISQQDQEITQGNPSIKPASSFNIDILGERYFTNIGILSGGIFHKRINDFNFASLQRVQGGAYDGFFLQSTANGDVATLWGFELNWQQNFTFLPGVLSGLGIYANYTYTYSDAAIQRGDDPSALTKEKITLPGQADHIFNAALSYNKGKFQGRLAANYNGSFISELAANAQDDIISDTRMQLDFSASYGINDKFRVFAEVNNITDAPVRFYQGVESRPFFQEYYSWWARLGLKFNL